MSTTQKRLADQRHQKREEAYHAEVISKYLAMGWTVLQIAASTPALRLGLGTEAKVREFIAKHKLEA